MCFRGLTTAFTVAVLAGEDVKLRARALKLESYRPKPHIFPDGFILVIDTREQKPLCTRIKGLNSLVETVRDGDYTIKGFEDKFAIERKQTSDFYGYIGKERVKTVKKLKRLAQFDFAALVIEASMDDLLSPNLYSSISPEVARGFLTSVNVRYGIHVYLDRSRKQIERWMLDRMIKYYKLVREV